MALRHYVNSQGRTFDLSLPDQCPICHASITPNIVYAIDYRSLYSEFNDGAAVALACPACHELFYAKYNPMSSVNTYSLSSYGPQMPITTAFPKEIELISPSFSNIYHQAEAAEAYGLHEIAGIGYRKALEFLVKDYAILMHPDEKGTIENAFLAKCIEKFIDQPRIKATAIAAVWLGNDEAHYTRKWVDKDINDLKQFIWTCHYWIMADYKASEASSMITDGNHNS